MGSKKQSIYDDQESQIQKQSMEFVEFLTRKGMLEDPEINDEKIRKAKKSTAQKAYHNTKILMEQYRMIVWVLQCMPTELAQELEVPTRDLDALARKIDLETALENKKLESRLSAIMKTRVLIDRIHDALSVVRKKPDNGEKLYAAIYHTYIDPVQRNHAELMDYLHMSTRTYYRYRKEALTIMSVRLWSAPSGSVDSWLEVLTLLEDI